LYIVTQTHFTTEILDAGLKIELSGLGVQNFPAVLTTDHTNPGPGHGSSVVLGRESLY
jgi:hypothetical protein